MTKRFCKVLITALLLVGAASGKLVPVELT